MFPFQTGEMFQRHVESFPEGLNISANSWTSAAQTSKEGVQEEPQSQNKTYKLYFVWNHLHM